MRKAPFAIFALLALIGGLVIAGCSSEGDGGGTGKLELMANGEDFVRQGFTSKDGWHLTFDHVYVTLTDVTAYQTNPPYDPDEHGAGIEYTSKVTLAGDHTVDLAEGEENAAPILVGTVVDAPAGHYNALSWRMVRAASGPAAGYALVIAGKGEKDGQAIGFTIKIENEYQYTCGEYVGAERKGFLDDGGTAGVEMTFHFDHIFGDAGTALNDSLNTGALGFEPLAQIATGGHIDENLAGLEAKLSPDEYQKVIDILPTLGHSGEGHCHCEW